MVDKEMQFAHFYTFPCILDISNFFQYRLHVLDMETSKNPAELKLQILFQIQIIYHVFLQKGNEVG